MPDDQDRPTIADLDARLIGDQMAARQKARRERERTLSRTPADDALLSGPSDPRPPIPEKRKRRDPDRPDQFAPIRRLFADIEKMRRTR